MRFVPSFDYAGRFIGIRDTASGRFVPNRFAQKSEVSRKRAKREARRLQRIAQALADAPVRDVLPGVRNQSHVLPMVGSDGEPITRRTRLEDRYPAVPGYVNAVKSSAPSLYHSARTVRRHTVPTGTLQDARSARGIGALTAARGGFARK